ncbi:hypothetical protein [Nostoc sp.]|uniref:hypothetical protein n=1 Tax=Nostoc sp. TaxID=1180 RepID=UPI002FF7D9CA
MNRFKSILLGGLLAIASIATISQNASAAEFKSDRDNFNGSTIAFNRSKIEHERQVREERARELRERQARELRERQARELRERQAREQHARELRERQARLHH